MSRWRRFRNLSWSDRGFLVLAVCGLVAVGVLLRAAGFERCLIWLRRSSRCAGQHSLSPEALELLRRRAYLISVAARLGPYRTSCLRRSLLLWWIARRWRFDPELRIGVVRETGGLQAHAWIEIAGEILNDRIEIVARYAAFDAASLPEEVSWS